MKRLLKDMLFLGVALVATLTYHAWSAIAFPMFLLAQGTPMSSSPVETLPEKYGALGTLIVSLFVVLVALWRRYVQLEDALREERRRDREEQAVLNKEVAISLRQIAESLVAMRAGR